MVALVGGTKSHRQDRHGQSAVITTSAAATMAFGRRSTRTDHRAMSPPRLRALRTVHRERSPLTAAEVRARR